MCSMQEKVLTVERILEKVDTSTQNQVFTNKLPFWTWRVCIRPLLRFSTCSESTQKDIQILNGLEWQLRIRNTKQPVPYLEVSSKSFWLVLKTTLRVLK